MADEEDKVDDFVQKYFSRDLLGEVCLFLQKNHECIFSNATLKRKIKQLSLRRRIPCYDIDAIRRKITEMLDGPNSNLRYHSVWHHLQMKVTTVPCKIVANLLKELDSQGVHLHHFHPFPYHLPSTLPLPIYMQDSGLLRCKSD